MNTLDRIIWLIFLYCIMGMANCQIRYGSHWDPIRTQEQP